MIRSQIETYATTLSLACSCKMLQYTPPCNARINERDLHAVTSDLYVALPCLVAHTRFVYMQGGGDCWFTSCLLCALQIWPSSCKRVAPQ
jgi:hypothetical protein